MDKVWDLIIVGAGSAGLTAGLYAVRAGLKTLVLEKKLVGGQIALSNVIENYPGFPRISGQELMKKFEEHAKKFGLVIEFAEVKSISSNGMLKVLETTVDSLKAKAVIVATGSSPRMLGVKGEARLKNNGVHYCAICDGPIYSGKKVAVVGGGDSAVKEAIFLSTLAKKVTVFHRRDTLRAEKILQENAFKNKKIEFVWNTVVEEFLGEKKLEKIRLKNIKTGKIFDEEFDAVFIYIGVKPNTSFVEVEKNDSGLIKVNDCMETSEKGIFAAGDCVEKCLKQVATCVGEGAIAAISAKEFIEKTT